MFLLLDMPSFVLACLEKADCEYGVVEYKYFEVYK